LSSDPDIRIQEEFEGKLRNIPAIEIKGGTDVSNAHNRAGEAEKSHRKAKKQDFRDYWTIISLAGVDPAMLRQESPTTNSWFDVAQVLAREGNDWRGVPQSICRSGRYSAGLIPTIPTFNDPISVHITGQVVRRPLLLGSRFRETLRRAHLECSRGYKREHAQVAADTTPRVSVLEIVRMY